jgi:hypothetical protein
LVVCTRYRRRDTCSGKIRVDAINLILSTPLVTNLIKIHDLSVTVSVVVNLEDEKHGSLALMYV